MNIKIIDKNQAKELIVKNHYSHKWTSCRYALGLFNDQDNIVGVAVYGYPVGRRVVSSISNLLTNNDVLELTRLWVHDDEPKNTESQFIGLTFKWLKKNTQIKCLISYSDPFYNHVGIIYQATNWLYQGNNTMLVKSYMHQINGEMLHARTCVAKYGTIKTEVLQKIDSNYQRIELKKKHRYIYILHKKDRKVLLGSLKHPILPYPKNNDNCNWVKKK